MSKSVKCTIYLFLTAIIWGFAFVAQRVGADYLGAFSFNGIRFLLGAASLVPVIFFFERHAPIGKKGALIGIGGGLILFTASTLQQYGVILTQNAGKSAFITSLYTVLVPLISFLMGKKIRIFAWIAAALAAVGLFLICMGEAFSFELGDLVLLIGAVFWAMHIIYIDKFVNDLPPLHFSLSQFLTCGAASMLMALVFELPLLTLANVQAALIPLLFGGIMSVGVAYTLQIVGQKGVEPSKAAIIVSCESVFSAIGGALILGERMLPQAYLGCVLIFAGVLLSQYDPKKKA